MQNASIILYVIEPTPMTKARIAHSQLISVQGGCFDLKCLHCTPALPKTQMTHEGLLPRSTQSVARKESTQVAQERQFGEAGWIASNQLPRNPRRRNEDELLRSAQPQRRTTRSRRGHIEEAA